MAQAFLESPVGLIRVESAGDRLRALRIGAVPDHADDAPILREAIAQVTAWFAGRLREFDLPLEPCATTRGPAHRGAIAAIAYGETASYGELARRIGSSPRAMGQACRRNPFPIIIPCHRVLGAGGAIGHYTGGQGIITKSWLLRHEQGVS